MRMQDLTNALCISMAMGYKLKERGMPTHSVDAARRWRDKNLDPSRRKEWRVDGNPGVEGEKRPRSSAVQPAAGDGGPLWHDSDLEKMPARFASAGDMGEWMAIQASEMVITRMVPLSFFRPIAIAAAAADAGLSIDGAQAQRLTSHLFNLYMTIFGGDKRYHLNGEHHHPDSREFAKLAAEIDAFLSDYPERSEGEGEGTGV